MRTLTVGKENPMKLHTTYGSGTLLKVSQRFACFCCCYCSRLSIRRNNGMKSERETGRKMDDVFKHLTLLFAL